MVSARRVLCFRALQTLRRLHAAPRMGTRANTAPRPRMGATACETYETRLGFTTPWTPPFVCVMIRQVIEATGGYAECGYVEEILDGQREPGAGILPMWAAGEAIKQGAFRRD